MTTARISYENGHDCDPLPIQNHTTNELDCHG